MEDIAVVGFSFKLPQDNDNISRFWDTLQNRRNLMTEWPASRINVDSFSNASLRIRNKLYSRGAYFINEDPGAFDAPFFSVTAAEAASMDPMQRWTLEAAYRAFENSGIPVENLKGSRMAVFSASMTDDYSRMAARDPENAARTAITGTFPSILPNRLSWYFDLLGPSVHVDTACSGSLVAIDLACQSIRSGDASSALVTGSNLILGPDGFLLLSSLNFLSPDSKCYSFDHRANGYARGEGVVAIVLKRLSDAVRDGDMIRSVIRSTGTNQDGHTPGLTQPSPEAQESLIRHVYKKANLSFEYTRYVEAHGTGTPVGDPIEMKAIGRVFRAHRSAEEPLFVGSVKANIGHLEGCSGLAGIIKSILILEKGIIPPNALFEKINSDIDIDFYHTVVPVESISWPSDGLRRISVNSFGFGGTNTHVVLDDAYHYLQDKGVAGNHSTVKSAAKNHIPTTNGSVHTNGTSHYANGIGTNGIKISDATNGYAVNGTNGNSGIHYSNGINGTDGIRRLNVAKNNGVNVSHHSTKRCRLLVWSAADEKALERTIQGHKTYYKQHIMGNIENVDRLSYTLAARRSRMLWRTFAVIDEESHSKGVELSTAKLIRTSAEAALAFVFTGQGAQYADMGVELLQYPVFHRTLQQIDEVYSSLGCEWSIFDELRNPDNIDKPEYSQPLSTAIQIGLVELLRTFRVIPKAVVGHSSGEIAAAYAIGALSLHSACKISYYRGQMAGKLRTLSSSSGTMMSVNLAQDEVQSYLNKQGSEYTKYINVACVNSLVNCTLSGCEFAIDVLKKQLDKDGIFAQKLKTGVAYHSPYMLRIAREYLLEMGILECGNSKLKGVRSSIPMVSSVTGRTIRPSLLTTAQYWVDNMVSPVQFADAMQLLCKSSLTLKVGTGCITDIAEIGSHCALRRPIQDTLGRDGNHKKVRYMSVLHRSKSAVQSTLEFVGYLFCHGHTVSITTANQQLSTQRPLPTFLVDCPEYPFDHSRIYWAESRLSKDFRLREPVSGDTLGSRFYDWNPLEPRWRNFWSVETTPWIGDHVVSDTIIFPAAGMLVMAMEAVQQTATVNRLVSGYYVKEAHFLSPIFVEKTWDSKTETLLHLRPVRRPYEKESVWSDIKIFAYVGNQWTECFQATVQIQYAESNVNIDGGLEGRMVEESVLHQYQVATTVCTRPIESQRFYKDSAKHGIRYGGWFELLEDIRWDGKSNVLTRVNVSTPRYQTTSLVHPAILDAAFQALRVGTTKGLSASSPTHVPMRLHDAWFAASGWQPPLTASIRYMVTTRSDPGREGKEGSIYALADDGSTLCTMRRMITAPVSKNDEPDHVTKKLLYGVEWKPQLSLLDSKKLLRMWDASTVKDETTMITYYQKLGSLLDKVVCRILKQMSNKERESVPSSLKRHLAWMEHHAKQLIGSPAHDEISDAELESLMQEVEPLNPPWNLNLVVARQLKRILVGEIDPLSVIFDSNMAEIFYEDMFKTICDRRLAQYIELASHENPRLRILEVGAGTGGMTTHILSTLQDLEKQSGGRRFANYTYTDLSPTFFEKASIKWQDLEERMTFKILNLEHNVVDQGIDPGAYDLVIAGSVLHATADLEATIRNVRQTLRPGGRLVLLEAVAPEKVITNFVFGLAPGWWNCVEDWRAWSPAIVEEKWDECLRANGFSGNDLCIRDYESDISHIFNIIMTTAEEQAKEPSAASNELFLVIKDDSDQQVAHAGSVYQALQTSTRRIRILSLDRFRSAELRSDDVVVFLVELHEPFLSTISERGFSALQDLIRRTQNLLWVTCSRINDARYLEYSIVQGFLRSIRTEAIEKNVITLAIESRPDDSDATYAQYIAKTFKAAFESSSLSGEVDYVVRDGQIGTARAAEEILLNQTLKSLLYPPLKHKAWLSGPALKLTVGTPGILDTLQFVEDHRYAEELGPREVEIEAKAWGLNFRDVYVALGRLDDGALGGDCAGIVTRVGPSCTSGLQLGDRVCMLVPGCMRTYPRALESCVLKIPNSLSFEAAASITAPGVTAYYSLLDVARLRKGQKILIHSAAGSTGQMAIWIAKTKGAEIFATVGFDEKKQFLMDRFGISEDHIFYSRNTTFAQGIMRVTKGYGVDVVLNSLSGDALRASWECVAPYGRFVEIGKADIMANSSLPMACFAKNVSFSAVDLVHLIESDEELTAALLKSTVGLLRQGVEHPSPLHIYPVSKIEQAFRYLQSGKNIGRIVIGIDRSDVVPQRVLERRCWKFDANSSYLVAGGSGGLGRAIMKWMASRGVKHLIVPSRSGPTAKAAEVVAELTRQGIEIVAPKCDVSSAESLAAVLEDCARFMPPIKGCINAAMVLQDAIFDNMTHAQWALTISSKMKTSWNLHHLLPKDLDFFVLLSSLAGVCGTVAQSNYAGGCSAQDAIARYRVAQGQKAVSFDVGWMRNIGIIAEKESYQRHRQNAADMQQIDDTELMALLSIYCDPELPLLSVPKSQILIGLLTPTDFIEKGQAVPEMHDRPLYGPFSYVVGEATSTTANGAAEDPAELFRKAAETDERIQIVIRALSVKLARAMAISPEDVEPSKPLSSYGVDSLMAVELRNYIGREFQATVAVFDIMGGVPIAAIGDLVVERSSVGKSKGVPPNGQE
ncbi:hypothetical protein F5X99DRAFT_390720 [Biscogniauxia marginata]|nr:hypothetical protein F5X99DRAFT_390720 [Biscogniauxia marginata]